MLAWPGRLRALGHAVFFACAATLPVSAVAETTEAPSPLDIFQQQEDLLFQTGYRLAKENAPFCDRRTFSLGLLIHDAASYGQPEAVRAHFGLLGDIGVQSVAMGSPAEAAGILQNDTLLSVSGQEVESLARRGDEAWARAARIAKLLESPALDGKLRVSFRNAQVEKSQIELAPVELCSSRFELRSGTSKASADGERVLIGDSFPAFSYSTPKFAAALAHEMAHNLLGHLDYLDRHGRGGGRVRASERDADRLMPWLLFNAGYDPQAAVDFMEEWGPRHGGGILRKRSHDGWDERVEFIAAELPKIEAVAVDGKADWRSHFQPLLIEKE